ncbi:MAG: protein-disulfide reductase DsbD, partial [Chlorobiaceae bacterium]|nr:protein-disulfide reductase DsbD [Chlorobiaceae bacterium]
MMKQRNRSGMVTIVMMAIVMVLSMFGRVKGAEFLDPEQAFVLKATQGADRALVLHWDIAEGYKLYRDRVKVSVSKGQGEVKVPEMPKGITVSDPSTGEKMEIYHDRLDVSVPVVKSEGKFTVSVQ